MNCQHITFTGHAIQRMFERNIRKDEVLAIISRSEIIADYPNDSPYPSYLLLGAVNGRSLHLVIAVDDATGNCYVVTVYIPNQTQWCDDFRTRR